MDDILLYANSHPEIEEIVVIESINSSRTLPFDICRGMKVKRMTVCVPTKRFEKEIEENQETFHQIEPQYEPDEFEIITQKQLCDYQKKHGCMALVFDMLMNNEDIIRLRHLAPEFLIGILDTHLMNAYDIWEAYRNKTERIYIVSVENADEKREVLRWDKRKESDIELSVIFPMYKVEAYLPQCIESVTAWKADYIEYLFVDDGSPDHCADIVRAYAQKDSRIKLLQKENGGCASARQYGLDRARGRYVGFIDPDDFIDESMFRKLLCRAMIGGYEISYCGYKELYEENGEVKEIDDLLGWPYSEGTTDPNKINELIAYRRIAIWRGIYLKSMIDRNKIHFYEDVRRFDDLPFKCETFSKARSVVSVQEYLYYYRMSRPGQDVSANDERLYTHFLIFQYLDEFFKKTNQKKQMDYLEVVKIQTHRWALEKIKPELVVEYCQQAKKDLLSNFSFIQASGIVRRYCSKKDWLYYIAICTKCVLLIKWLVNRGSHANKDAVRFAKGMSRICETELSK